MWRYGVMSALTSDKHFAQAGFRILMSVEPRGVAEPTPVYRTEAATAANWMTNQIRDAA